MSLESLDSKYGALFNAYAQSQGFKYLHAGEMGMGRLVGLFPKLTKIIKRDNLRFFLGITDKRWLIMAKLFDTIFDPVDNRAVAQHTYWVAPFRYILLIKLHHITREDDLRDIWAALTTTDFEEARALLERALRSITSRIGLLPDQRSREVIGEAMEWAAKHPEELGIKFQTKKLILNHHPNVAMLTPLLSEVQRQAEHWKTAPKVITHDQSSQFQSAWRELHQNLTNANGFEFQLIGGPKQKLGIDKNSSFVIGDSRTSAGIQFIDIALWLWKRAHGGVALPAEAQELIARILKNTANPFEMSYDATVNLAEQTMAPIMEAELTEADIERGKRLLKESETNRKARMAEFN